MLKLLTQKLNLWKKDGSHTNKEELYEIIEAIEAINRAQFFAHTEGSNPEIGSKKAAEIAIAGAASSQDAGTKQ